MNNNSQIWFFSVFSGNIYKLPESFYGTLDEGQLPLKKAPTSCKKCYSRGYTGFTQKTFTYMPCTCVSKIVDTGRIKQKFNIQSSRV